MTDNTAENSAAPLGAEQPIAARDAGQITQMNYRGEFPSAATRAEKIEAILSELRDLDASDFTDFVRPGEVDDAIREMGERCEKSVIAAADALEAGDLMTGLRMVVDASHAESDFGDDPTIGHIRFALEALTIAGQ